MRLIEVRTLAVLLSLCLLFLGGAGGWLAHAMTHKPVVVPVVQAQPLGIRCANGSELRMWTQVETEARYHEGAMWQRTAEEAGVWNGRGQRAFRLAVLAYLETIICRPEMP